MAGGIQKTSGAKWVIVLRIVGGAPLLLFGVMHIAGMMPMKPLIEAAGMPMPDVMAIVAPLMQILGGALLVSGAFTRLGGLLGLATMFGAIYTHIKIPNDQWPDPNNAGQVMEEPVFMLAIAGAIVLCSLVVLFVGGGRWSLDHKMTSAGGGGSTGGNPESLQG